jgi:hypothetical protein
VDAAKAVEDAKADLANAVVRLTQEAVRSVGWDNLVEACKIIAGKTVLLLTVPFSCFQSHSLFYRWFTVQN